jgi:hypothetical protein
LVADLQAGSGSNLPIALSRFQGTAIGLAFTVGIPLGNLLVEKYGIFAALQTSIGLCLLNAILIATLLPRNSPGHSTSTRLLSLATSGAAVCGRSSPFLRASPLGALMMLGRTKGLFVSALAYLLATFAHAGMQATWVNYLSHRFSWSSAQSGATLMVIGLAVALLPPLFMYCTFTFTFTFTFFPSWRDYCSHSWPCCDCRPLLGTARAIECALFTHALSLLFLGEPGFPSLRSALCALLPHLHS